MKDRTEIAHDKQLIRYRQKVIKMADSSELGWKVVAEYEMDPLASD